MSEKNDVVVEKISTDESVKSSRSSKSSKGSSKSRSKTDKKESVKIEHPVSVPVIDSDEIDVSQLEMIANKKKLVKKQSDIQELSVKQPSKSTKRRSRKSSSSSSSDSKSSTSDDKKKKKRIQKENMNEYIRKEKSELLYKFNKIHMLDKWSSLKFDMNNSLEEIKNEFDRVTNAIKVDRSVRFLKKMLLLGVQGFEMLNTKFDPLGVDLDGWSEAMTYNMDNQDYDEVMAELYEKYKSVGNMSPEFKLMFMIISSAAFFTISKKLTSAESQGSIMNMLNNMMSKQQQPQQTQQMPIPQMPMQMPQMMPMQMPQMQQMPVPQQMLFARQPQNVNHETTDDNMPSKINDPHKIQDTIALNNILDTMKKRQLEKKEKSEKSESMNMTVSENKVIPAVTGRKRGRAVRGKPK